MVVIQSWVRYRQSRDDRSETTGVSRPSFCLFSLIVLSPSNVGYYYHSFQFFKFIKLQKEE